MESTTASSAARHGSGIWTALAVVGLLACYLTLGISASTRKSQTGDEGIHLAGGVSFWETGDYRVQPASGNWPQHWCALPVWLAGYQFPSLDSPTWRDLTEWNFAEEFCYGMGNDVDRMLLLGRSMAAIFGVALALVVFFWSRALFGTSAGLLSLALFAFSPTMLSNGFLILADMSSALFFTAAVGALWLLVHRVSPLTLALSWFTLSGVFLVKFSGPVIVPMGLALVGVRLMNPAPLVIALGRTRELRGRLLQATVLAGLVPVLVLGVAFLIWASFGFRYSLLNPDVGPPTREINWNAVKNRSEGVNRVIDLSREHHLLPEAYIYGLSHTLRTAEERAAFLNGEFRQRGWVSYFPYCLIYKTPLELFFVLALSVAALGYFRKRGSADDSGVQGQQDATAYEVAPLLILLVVYWAFSLTSHLNIGHRHLLPTYPAMMILAGAAAWWWKAPADRAVRSDAKEPSLKLLTKIAVAGAMVALLAESLWFWPHYLAYFNPVAGGPRHGYRHLGDSSLDWSQDLKEMKRWLDEHRDDTRDPQRLYLSFYGGVPTDYYGVNIQRLPSFPDRWKSHVPEPLRSGTYIISATMLQCFMLNPPGRWNQGYEASYQQAQHDLETYLRLDENATGRAELARIALPEDWQKLFHLYERLRFSRLASYLRTREPDEEIGYSILVYRLSDDDLARALDGPPVEELSEPEWETENRRSAQEAPPG